MNPVKIQRYIKKCFLSFGLLYVELPPRSICSGCACFCKISPPSQKFFPHSQIIRCESIVSKVNLGKLVRIQENKNELITRLRSSTPHISSTTVVDRFLSF